MTRAQNRRYLLLSLILSCAVASVFLAAGIGWIADVPSPFWALILIATFLAGCGVVILLGPLGVFPHIKKTLPEGAYRQSLWFVPDLKD